MPITYLDGPRLRRALLAACEQGQEIKAELNRINVFPVPDGDTGTNLALTLGSISETLAGLREPRVDRVAEAASQAAVMGARGNCGMMLSHFLIGFATHLDGHERVTTTAFGAAFSAGSEALEGALDNPVEGTILSVIRDSAAAACQSVVTDFAGLMSSVHEQAQLSLARTPDLLPVLRAADVVDAGAKGFVALIEGVVRLIEVGGSREAAPSRYRGPRPSEAVDDRRAIVDGPSPVSLADFPHERGSYRFCTEGLVKGDELPPEAEVRAALREGAEEVIVIRTGAVLKVHLHTDHPDRAFDYLRTLGTLVTHKAEDMWVQHEAAKRTGGSEVRRPVGVVVDSASDIPEAVVRAHGLQVVPLVLIDGDATLLDRVEITAEAFHRRLAAEGRLPTTSQPTPASFVEAFKRGSSESEALVAVLLGSGLSGTLGSAEAARRLVPELDIRIVDSRGASLLTGLLALKAAELAEAGVSPDEIVREVNRVRLQSNILFTVRQLDRVIASGRVNRFSGWLGGVLDLKPVLGLGWGGEVKAYGKARGADRVRELLLDTIEKEIPAGVTKLRFGVVHVGAPELLDPIVAAVTERFGEREVITAPATPVIATHLGVGAWGVAYMVED